MPTWQPRNTQRARALRNAATPAERLLWQYLGAGRLNGVKFSRQMPIGPYFADFLSRSRQLVIELDGYSHDVAPDRDIQRDVLLQALGYRVLRFTNEEVMTNVEGVIAIIAQTLVDLPTPNPSRKREGSE